mgnify:CR=1 FL=1
MLNFHALSFLDFIKKLDQQKNPYTRLYLLRNVKNNQNIVVSDTDLMHLRNVISFVQYKLSLPLADNSLSELKKIDLELALHLTPNENNWDISQLDILCDLLDYSQKK